MYSSVCFCCDKKMPTSSPTRQPLDLTGINIIKDIAYPAVLPISPQLCYNCLALLEQYRHLLKSAHLLKSQMQQLFRSKRTNIQGSCRTEVMEVLPNESPLTEVALTSAVPTPGPQDCPTDSPEGLEVPRNCPTGCPEGLEVPRNCTTDSPEGMEVPRDCPTDSPEGLEVPRNCTTDSPEGLEVPRNCTTDSPEGLEVPRDCPTDCSEGLEVLRNCPTDCPEGLEVLRNCPTDCPEGLEVLRNCTTDSPEGLEVPRDCPTDCPEGLGDPALHIDIQQRQTASGEVRRVHVCVCDECGARFHDNARLTSHRDSAHCRPIRTRCNICAKTLRSRAAYLQHLSMHAGRKLLPCPLCSSSFKAVNSLRYHLQTHPSAADVVSCDNCDGQFVSESRLRTHQQREHGVDKPWRCLFADCEKAFKSSASLKLHAYNHTDHRPFQCCSCSKRFASRRRLLIHTRVHTGERPFQCDVCGMRFCYQPNLHQHMASHRNPWSRGSTESADCV